MSGGCKSGHNKKKNNQKHQNKTAFKIVFDTQALEMQKKVSLINLCHRCHQVMQWKLQYNKYKRATQAGKCNICLDKNVYRSYMKACQPCVQAKNICAKCLTPDYQKPQGQIKISQIQQRNKVKQQTEKQIQFMKTLQQRSRRTIRRNLQKGKISWDNQEEYFVDQEGKRMIGLKFRKGFTIDEQGNQIDIGDDEDEDFSGDEDFQEDQDLEQQQHQENENDKKSKSSKNQSKPQKNKEKKSKKLQNQQQQQNLNINDSDFQGDQVECQFQQDDQQDQKNNQQTNQHQQQQGNNKDQDFEDLQSDDQQQQQEQIKKKNNKKNKNNKNKIKGKK